MLDALSASQGALHIDELKLQLISHNVANMSTPGFKKQLLDHIPFENYLTSNLQNIMAHTMQSTIDTQGTLDQTHKSTDLALSGGGYFQVQNDKGLFYTRRGDFTINQHGELTTRTGETVLGKRGVIKVDDQEFTIDKQGQVFIDQHKIDELNIVQFTQPLATNYLGNGLYETNELPKPAEHTVRVLQGFIEQSNVTSLDEMMDMIKFSRHFEANQRIMRTANELITTAINQLGESHG